MDIMQMLLSELTAEQFSTLVSSCFGLSVPYMLVLVFIKALMFLSISKFLIDYYFKKAVLYKLVSPSDGDNK